jgi:hypothetical protein
MRAAELYFGKSESGGLYEKYAVATWNLENNLSVYLKKEETQETLRRDGRSQDHPDAY